MSAEQLEQLRLLTNTDMDSTSHLGLILLGQPTLRRRLKQGQFAALDQRIGLRFHLDGLPPDEIAAYADSKGIVDEASARAAVTEVTTD